MAAASSSTSSPPPPAAADGHCADYSLFSDALRHFADRQHELDSALKASQRSLDHQFAAHDSLLKQCQSQWAEYARLQAMQRDLRRELSKEEKAVMRDRLEDERITMEMAKQELDQWRQAKPGNQSSTFLRLVLGRVNYQLWKRLDRLEFKDAYNKFKRDTTIIFLIFPRQPLTIHTAAHSTETLQPHCSLRHHAAPASFVTPHRSALMPTHSLPCAPLCFVLLCLPLVVQLLLAPHRVLFQLHQLWLLYYYFTLSLRENILYANGSSMKRWWIFHHYVSICITLLILLYPDDFYNPLRHTRLMLFGLAQGAVMLCQFLYQSKRAYVRKTLGKAKSIDVDATETLVEKPTDLKWFTTPHTHPHTCPRLVSQRTRHHSSLPSPCDVLYCAVLCVHVRLVPILYALYLYEGYIGVDVLSIFVREGKVGLWGTTAAVWESRPWHLVGIGLGCLVLGVGNCITTSMVLVGKQKHRKWTALIRSRERVKPPTIQPLASSNTDGDHAAQAADGKAEKSDKQEGKGEQASGGKLEATESKDQTEEGDGGPKGGKTKVTRRRK